MKIISFPTKVVFLSLLCLHLFCAEKEALYSVVQNKHDLKVTFLTSEAIIVNLFEDTNCDILEECGDSGIRLIYNTEMWVFFGQIVKNHFTHM